MIQAKVIADSRGINGDRITTLEVVMPRYILAEFNTHRMFSRNSASSRAIPFNKMIQSVKDNPFIPYAWQEDHKGMQGTKYMTSGLGDIEDTWLRARDNAVEEATILNKRTVTKQIANRLLEPFMYHKVLVTATEWENFFNLRCPQYELKNITKETNTILRFKSWKDLCNQLPVSEKTINASILEKLQINTGQADIHMMFLAEAIYDAVNESTPRELKAEEWHIPYGDNMDTESLQDLYKKHYSSGYNPDNPTPDEYYYKTLDELKIKISIARCARLSYQTLGDNPVIDYEKDLELYENLSTSGHWSPFEHVARSMNDDEYHYYTKTKPLNGGVYTEKGWCRNYKGFIQYRELLD